MSSHLTQGGRSIYGRGKPKGDYEGISAEEIINNPEEALKKHKDLSEGAVDNANQKIIEFNKINNSLGAAFKNDTLRKLSNQIDSDIANIRSISDYKAAKVNWTTYISQLSADPISNKVSPEISAFISNASRMIDRKGITVGISEASKKSLDVVSSSFDDSALALNDGDLSKANTHYRQTLNMLNEFEAIGSINKGLAKSLRRTYQRKFNDRTMGAIQHSTFTMMNTSGFGSAQKYLNKVKGMVNISKGSLPKQRAYTKFLSLFKKMPDSAILKAYDKSIDNWVKHGIGNPKNLVKDADSNIARLEGMKGVGSNNEGITSLQNEIKAFKKLGTAYGDIYNKGDASVFSPLLLEGLNSKNSNGLIAALNETDPDVIDDIAKMNTTLTHRIQRESGGDPVKKASIIDTMFQKGIGTSKIQEPSNIFETIAHEKEVSKKYYGEEMLSQETKDNIIEDITLGDPSDEGQEYKQNLLNSVGKNFDIQAGLLKASNGDFNTDLQQVAAKYGKELSSIFPTPGNVQVIQSLFNRDGFKSTFSNIRKEIYADENLSKTANMLGVSREHLAYNMGLDIAVRATRNIPGELSFGQINNNIANEDVKKRLQGNILERLDKIKSEYYVSNTGNFSVQSNSSLGKSLKEFDTNIAGFSAFGYNIAKALNKEEFHPGKFIHDLFSTEETVTDNKTKDGRIKFYNVLSNLTGIPPESFTNRLSLKQHSSGNYYYLTFPTKFNAGFHNVKSNNPGITKNSFKISEDSMRIALTNNNRDNLIKFLAGAIVNDSER